VARLKALARLRKDGRPRSTLETLCIDRLVGDLEHEGQNGLVWRESEAERSLAFCRLLKHWKGEWAGQPFEPEPWQEHLTIAPIFGWYRETPDGLRRRFTVGYEEIPRKNGKTFKAAVIGCQGLIADGEQGAEVYAAATKRDQAGILFKDAKQTLMRSDLLKFVKLWQHSITCDTNTGTFQPLSSDYNSLHGLNVHRAICDEIHSWKSRDLWDVLQTATGARRNPLLYGITTAGYNRSTICWELHEYARNILEGNHADDTFFTFIACADADADPFDPETWSQANPNLDISIRSEYLRQESHKAKQSPSYENTFRRLHLNQWTEQAVRWLPMHVWDACDQVTPIEELRGRPCFAGLDLAATRDVNALVLLFPDADGSYDVLPYFWVPREIETDRQGRDRRQVLNWAHKGLITMTDGNVADYDRIAADIADIAGQFDIQVFGFDPYGAAPMLAQKLEKTCIPHDRLREFRQTITNLNGPTKEFERLLVGRKLRHRGDPVLRWMAGNVAVKPDANDNIRPDKAKSADKIDGIVAAIIALGCAMGERDVSPRFYDNHKLELI